MKLRTRLCIQAKFAAGFHALAWMCYLDPLKFDRFDSMSRLRCIARDLGRSSLSFRAEAFSRGGMRSFDRRRRQPGRQPRALRQLGNSGRSFSWNARRGGVGLAVHAGAQSSRSIARADT